MMLVLYKKNVETGHDIAFSIPGFSDGIKLKLKVKKTLIIYLYLRSLNNMKSSVDLALW